MKDKKPKMKEEEKEEKPRRQLHFFKKGNLLKITAPNKDMFVTSIPMMHKFTANTKQKYLYVETELENYRRYLVKKEELLKNKTKK